MNYSYEYTDTYGGEANYNWVRKGEVAANNITHAARLAKKAVGINGISCKRNDFGDMIALYPSRHATVLFITEK